MGFTIVVYKINCVINYGVVNYKCWKFVCVNLVFYIQNFRSKIFYKYFDIDLKCAVLLYIFSMNIYLNIIITIYAIHKFSEFETNMLCLCMNIFSNKNSHYLI